ncbi:hypothetical protein [Streptomyces hebeiensis]
MPDIKAFIGKPVLVHAVKWTGDNFAEIKLWGGSLVFLRDGNLFVHTINGVVPALVGDWITRGTQGEFYPIRPRIMESKYEQTEVDPLNLKDSYNAPR